MHPGASSAPPHTRSSLMRPPLSPKNYTLERRWSLTHFLIGLFGATAILGVMAKIFAFNTELFGVVITWKPVVLVGFLGEALVFILMGLTREMRYVPAAVDTTDDDSPPASEPPPPASPPPAEVRRESERLAQTLQTARKELSDELTDTHRALAALRTQIARTAARLERFNAPAEEPDRASETDASAHSSSASSK